MVSHEEWHEESCVGYRIGEDSECPRQQLSLARECFDVGIGTILHELLHTIGFYHMQNSYDRDDYVKSCYKNINKADRFNFIKYPKEIVTNFGVPYDYESIMHYAECDFSINGKKTIIPIKENITIGQRNRLSIGDIKKINRMYNCKESEEKSSS